MRVFNSLEGQPNLHGSHPEEDFRKMISRQQRYRIASLLVLLSLLVIAVPAIRQSILQAAGKALVVTEHASSADIIVISGEADGAGELEASDLIHSGVAPKVAVFAYAPDEIQNEFVRRGAPYEDSATRSIRRLKALGVENIVLIPGYVRGTQNEGPLLTRWCDQQGFRSIIVVGVPDHTRRLRRVLRRNFKGHRTMVVVCSARHAVFDPDRWWKSRDGIRTEIGESEKLFLDIVLHPFS
jgi:hypothetical protein